MSRNGKKRYASVEEAREDHMKDSRAGTEAGLAAVLRGTQELMRFLEANTDKVGAIAFVAIAREGTCFVDPDDFRPSDAIAIHIAPRADIADAIVGHVNRQLTDPTRYGGRAHGFGMERPSPDFAEILRAMGDGQSASDKDDD